MPKIFTSNGVVSQDSEGVEVLLLRDSVVVILASLRKTVINFQKNIVQLEADLLAIDSA